MATTTALTLESLAAEANRLLTRTTRPGERESIVVPVDDAPEWFGELCREAHGDMMPDDWRYEFIEDALTQIENGDEEPRSVDSAYPYTADRLNWLASRNDRMGYCDEGISNYGDGIKTMDSALAIGMATEMDEVFNLVKSQLETRLEELEDEQAEFDKREERE